MVNLEELQRLLTVRDDLSVKSLDPDQLMGIDPKKLVILYQANALAGEAGELCNIVKKIIRDNLIPFNEKVELLVKAKDQGYETAFEMRKAAAGKEIADVIQYCGLIAQALDLDLAYITKEKFNEVSDKQNLNIKL